jgi:CheY-like chemotaxis protein
MKKPKKKKAAATVKEKPSLVVADDHFAARIALQDILSEKGYNVDVVSNGYSLLSYLKKKRPKVIILDLMMPEKSGLSILSTIRSISQASIVVYTAFEEFKHSPHAGRVDGLVFKNEPIEKLLTIIKDLA